MASSSFVTHGKYDVFLSFRGEDTRKSFTDHLYTALKNKGINVFRDDIELEKGGSISPELLKAIEESRISIIVLSKNYASSTWCLDELVKIVECKNKEDKIFPVFYDVEPTVVRKQTGSFGEAFAKHEEVFRDNIEKVQKWRDALKVVANKSGWELKDSNESEFIEKIVNVISRKIHTEPEILKELVGIESRLEKLMSLMSIGSNDVRMIGIWGMGGLGKTTLARVVYDLISHEFDGSSFLADVRETYEKQGSVISLQKQLLSDLLKLADNSIRNVYDGINMIGSRLRQKKVLLVIDDVADDEQLQSLAGKLDWFGKGSRIIITTRDRHSLKLVRHSLKLDQVKEVYELEALTYDEAFRLFCLKAFDTHKPLEEYVKLAESVVMYASGLPLALKVLGSFLVDRPVDEWTSTLERLKRDPEKKILDILQISFDGLKETEKKIFLDVACFFKGQKRDYVSKILDSCDFDPVIGIAVLIEKSLLTVNNNRLWMHDLLQELGHQIVQRQSAEEPGKRSRLWREEEVRQVLTEDTGSEVVEGIMVDFKVCISASAKAFSKMTNLRLLKISNVLLPEGLEYLSNNLRLLDWGGYPLQSLPSNFQLNKTLEFKSFEKLKVMKLVHSQRLIEIPDCTGVPNLEELDLEGCTRLREIHPSLLLHGKLIILYLKNCTSLETLPSTISMKSLAKLFLGGCSKLKKFPEITGSMECLSKLFLGRTAIEELPSSIKSLSKLVVLDLNNCKNLKSLPETKSGLKCLSTLCLSGSSKFKKFPDIVGSMENLTKLQLEGTAITKLPESIGSLFALDLLNLKDCRNLESLPNTVSSLKCLRSLKLSGCSKLKKFPEIVASVKVLYELYLDGTSITELPSSIEGLTGLTFLNLKDCKNLVTLPSCTNGLKRLHTVNLCGCFKLEKVPPSLLGSCPLMKLDLSECNIGDGGIPTDIDKLYALEKLCLSKNSFVSLPESIRRLFKLKDLDLEGCKMLQILPTLPASIRNIIVDGCDSLEILSDVLKLNKLEQFTIRCTNCLKLNDSGLSLLKEYIKQNMSNRSKYCSIVVPGSEIPEWFEYQNNEGSSVSISRPPKTYRNSKLVGYAMCCVFHVHKHSLPSTAQELKCEMRYDKEWGTRDDFFDKYSRYKYTSYKVSLFESSSELPVSDHLWLQFEANEYDRKYNEVSFKSLSGLKLRRCGVQPLYEHQVEKFNETTTRWNSNDFRHDSSSSTSSGLTKHQC